VNLFTLFASFSTRQGQPANGCSCAIAALALAVFVGSAASLAAAENRGHPTRTFAALGFEPVALRRTGENHLFVVARVEGRKRSCLIDTGWSFSTVSTNTAGRLGATNELREMVLGNVSLTNVPVRVSDLRVNGQPTSYDVVLGCDFLLRHKAILDCGSERLYLRREDDRSAPTASLSNALEEAGWTAIDLQRLTPAALTCAARIQGRDTALLVDSGAMWSCLDAEFAGLAGLRLVGSPHRLGGPGARAKRTFDTADVKSWSIGNQVLPERTMAVLDLADWGLGAGGKLFSDVGGILGGAELAAFEALVDCGSLKLWLRRRR
jgi:predicted aspartyl protease